MSFQRTTHPRTAVGTVSSKVGNTLTKNVSISLGVSSESGNRSAVVQELRQVRSRHGSVVVERNTLVTKEIFAAEKS